MEKLSVMLIIPLLHNATSLILLHLVVKPEIKKPVPLTLIIYSVQNDSV